MFKKYSRGTTVTFFLLILRVFRMKVLWHLRYKTQKMLNTLKSFFKVKDSLWGLIKPCTIFLKRSAFKALIEASCSIKAATCMNRCNSILIAYTLVMLEIWIENRRCFRTIRRFRELFLQVKASKILLKTWWHVRTHAKDCRFIVMEYSSHKLNASKEAF